MDGSVGPNPVGVPTFEAYNGLTTIIRQLIRFDILFTNRTFLEQPAFSILRLPDCFRIFYKVACMAGQGRVPYAVIAFAVLAQNLSS
jgi:hypothetical protein